MRTVVVPSFTFRAILSAICVACLSSAPALIMEAFNFALLNSSGRLFTLTKEITVDAFRRCQFNTFRTIVPRSVTKKRRICGIANWDGILKIVSAIWIYVSYFDIETASCVTNATATSTPEKTFQSSVFAETLRSSNFIHFLDGLLQLG